jgi:glycerol-3-phosphate acyltransferase PlsX
MPGPDAPIVLDAMGGDHAPRDPVAGAVAAVREHGLRMILAGDARTLWPLLDAHGAAPDIEVVHATEVIPMGDSGVRMRELTGTSAAVACGLVASGQAGALVSAGSTGGTVTTAVATLGCAPGVLRPAIAVLLPTAGQGTVLLDAGAIADRTPEMLAQFGVLGAGYARTVLGVESPTVGLLTIGSEPGKGNRLARRAQPLLGAAPVRFTGNVEGRDALAGAVDVVVTDGFTGNVALKTIEGSLRLAVTETRAALTAGPAGAMAQFANRGRLRRLDERFDADAHGGAVLLGLGGAVVIAHGSARALAITRACLLARDLVRAGITGQIGRAVAGSPAGALMTNALSRPAP